MTSSDLKMPVLFIGHGSPMNAIADNQYTNALKNQAGLIPTPKAILVISAHWLTRGTFVCNATKPQQIYDFYGFPDELYKIIYQPDGSKEFAELTADQLKSDEVKATENWGLDHASWAVLVHMYPKADIPVFEMSLNMEADESEHYNLGQKLDFLRNMGVLIIGSGDIVHNLRAMKYDPDVPAYDWAEAFETQIKDALSKRDHALLIHAQDQIKNYNLALPTNEHYLPLLYVAALQQDHESIDFFHESIQHGSISMTSFKIG
ncbi:MAG: 4,5-DOPA dioxygenase extradiol [Bacteroidota bacterium]|nr:4,5-DOPA dioxygenase extradiol [Bacteroidota bacterium]